MPSAYLSENLEAATESIEGKGGEVATPGWCGFWVRFGGENRKSRLPAIQWFRLGIEEKQQKI